MDSPGLLAKVRANVRKLLAGYIQKPEILEQIDSYIVACFKFHIQLLALAYAYSRIVKYVQYGAQ